jgi:PIN domain nuclease of toxin-antitoxin system
MKLLLDTATLLWVTYDAARLSPSAREAYADRQNNLYVTVASLWEIIVNEKANRVPTRIVLGITVNDV